MGRANGHQEDAYEFSNKAMSQNEIAEPFTATETTTTMCTACKSKSHPPGQITYATTVNITGDTNHTIASLMQLKYTREVMEGENAYECEKCNQFTRQENTQPHATTQLTTNTQLLKSQGCSTNIHNTACGRARHTDQLVRQIQQRTQWQSNLQGDNGGEQKEVSSKTVIVHTGTAHGGHYIAFTHTNGAWTKFNNALTSTASWSEIKNMLRTATRVCRCG